MAHSPIEYEWFLSISSWSIDGNLTGTTTTKQSEPRTNDNERVLDTPRISKTDAVYDTSYFGQCLYAGNTVREREGE